MSATEVTWESPTSTKGPRQIHIPKRKVIASLTGLPGVGGVAQAIVRTPDSRLTSKITVIPNKLTALFGGGLTIWYGGLDDDQSGPSGAQYPVTNIIPGTTRALPQSYPQDAGLLGYGREFVSSVDNVLIELTIPGYAPAPTRTITIDTADEISTDGSFGPPGAGPVVFSLINGAFSDADVGSIILVTLNPPNDIWNGYYYIDGVSAGDPQIAIASPVPAAAGFGLTVTHPTEGEDYVIFPAGPRCDIFVQCRFQPVGQRLPWEEWDEVRKLTDIRIVEKITR